MNQSKKLFNLMAMLTFAAMFALVGCDDSSTDPDNPADALVGSWQHSSLVVYFGSSVANADSSEEVTDEWGSEHFTFNADGTGSNVFTDNDGGVTTGNWTYTATTDVITITTTEVGRRVVDIPYELSGNTLTITTHFEADVDYDEPEQWIVHTLTKQ